MNLDDVDIFQSGGLVESIKKLQAGGEVSPDALDRFVSSYEENVPLAGQIGLGLTPAGVAIDVAEVGKYGRDALRDFSEGRVGGGLGNLGIAGLSALGLVPIVGDLAKAGGKSVIKRQFLIQTPEGRVVLKQSPEGRKKLGDVASRELGEIFRRNISMAEKVQALKNHPLLRDDIAKAFMVTPTTQLAGFGTKQFKNNREFVFATPKGSKFVIGYNNAVNNLYTKGRKQAYDETGEIAPKGVVRGTKDKFKKDGKVAVITMGLPGVGKSTLANPVAKKLDATMIDADEVKKTLREFQGGVGANAVHKESQIIAEEVREVAMEQGDNLVLGKVGAKYDSIKNLANDLDKNGYRVIITHVKAPIDQIVEQQIGRQFRTGRLVNPDLFVDYTRKGLDGADLDLTEIIFNQLKKEGIYETAQYSQQRGLKQSEKIVDDAAGILEDL